MTKQERQALAKIALRNKNTKKGKELAKIAASDSEIKIIEAFLDGVTVDVDNAKKRIEKTKKSLRKDGVTILVIDSLETIKSALRSAGTQVGKMLPTLEKLLKE